MRNPLCCPRLGPGDWDPASIDTRSRFQRCSVSDARFCSRTQTTGPLSRISLPINALHSGWFGGQGALQKATLAVRVEASMGTLFQDLCYALRQVKKSPGFTAVAILTLAVGIGANTAIFGLVDALYLKPLAVPESDRLVRIYAKGPSGHYGAGFSYPEFARLRDLNSSFTALSVETQIAQLHMVAGGDSEEIRGELVSGNYFSILRVEPALGRTFSPEEDTVPNRDAVAVISDRLWKAHFNRDPAVLGREININGVGLKVIGIAPPEFAGDFTGRPTEIWIPAMMYGAVGHRCDDGSYDCSLFDAMIGRLAKGQTPVTAQAEVRSRIVWSATDWPQAPSRRQVALTSASGESPDDYADHIGQMRMLLSATAALLLIACVNLAGLLLARGVTRRREIAVRLSIGARRSRVIRQLLTESLLLASLGGTAGLAFSLGARQILSRFYATDSEGFQHFYDLSLDWRVLAYSIGLALITGALFGLVPAIRASRLDLVTELKDGGMSAQHTRGWLCHGLVIGQLAISMVLLICSGLLVRSALEIRRGTNFDPEHTIVLRLRPELTKYTQPQTEAVVRRVDQLLSAAPGIQSVAFMEGGEGLVWDWQSGREARVSLLQQSQTENAGLAVHKQDVGQNFFRTLKVPLLQGREFGAQDVPQSPRVAIVNEALARRLWSVDTAVGSTLFIDAQPFRVVGVSADVQPQNSIHDPEPHLYLSYWQSNATREGDIRFAIRVAGDSAVALRAIRRVVQSVDPKVPIGEDMSMSEQLNLEYMPVLLTENVMCFCGLLAVCLSAMGLYSILAFAVRTRTRELGIRIALGACKEDVLRLVVGQGAKLALVGVVTGTIAALVSTRLLASLLFGVKKTDPVTYTCATLLLVLVALGACYLPARRATGVDPVQALRVD
jgi:predicted permease